MSAANPFLQRTPLPQARALLLAGVTPVGSEELAVDDACGRVVAQDVLAQHPTPHYRASAMDGLAVRASDTWEATESSVLLRTVSADATPPSQDTPSCVVVDTGALLPDWTDAVVRIEDAVAEADGYRIRSVVAPGRDVRRAGEDIEAATLLLPNGSTIRPADLGAMLATGVTRIRVRRAPRVAILATGAEVVEPQQGARAGQVIEYNSRMIAAMVEQWGGQAHRLGIVADDEASLKSAVRDAARRFDVVAVVAGSSAGRKDFTVAVLASVGELLVQGVDMAPGRPVALARAGHSVSPEANRRTPVIAVPGYPVAAVVVCEQFLRPLLCALLGCSEPVAPTLRARIVRKIPSRLGMEEFRRVCLVRQLDEDYSVALLPSGAGSISTVTGAHGWLRIAPSVEGLDADAIVNVELRVSLAEIEAALVVASGPCAATAMLERRLRDDDRLARVATLGLGPDDALAAVERGEAHGALVASGQSLPATLRAHALPDGEGLVLAVRPDSLAQLRLGL